MILIIDTTQGHDVEITIKDSDRVVAQEKFKAKYSQAEKLLPGIDKILKSKKIKLADIESIKVANANGSFTALRIGVVTANALGYGLRIPVEGAGEKSCKHLPKVVKNCGFDVVKPIYNKEPNITIS